MRTHLKRSQLGLSKVPVRSAGETQSVESMCRHGVSSWLPQQGSWETGRGGVLIHHKSSCERALTLLLCSLTQPPACSTTTTTPSHHRHCNHLYFLIHTHFGMICLVNSLGLRTKKARPCGNHPTMSDPPAVSASSMASNFSGKGCVTPPVFLRTKPGASGTAE